MADDARVGDAALDVHFVADGADNRDGGAQPLPLHEDVLGGGFPPHDRGHAALPLVLDLYLAALQVALGDVVEFVLPADVAVGQLHQGPVLVCDLEVFADADLVLVLPYPHVLADAAFGVRHRVRIRPLLLELLLGEHFGDERPLRISARRVHRCGVKVDGERVANAADHQGEVETLGRLPLGQDAPVAPAHRDRILERGVVGDVSGAVPFNEADQAAIHLGDFRIAAVAHGGDVDAGPVLSLVVGDLMNERRQLVDGQTGALVDVALRHDFGRPLVALLEAPVVQAVLAVL